MERKRTTGAPGFWRDEALEEVLQGAKDSAWALTTIVGVILIFIGPMILFAGNKEASMIVLLLAALPILLEWKRYFNIKEKIDAGTYGLTEAERDEILEARQRLKQQPPP